MQHGMHNMCNAPRIGADDVESVLRGFLLHYNTIAVGFCTRTISTSRLHKATLTARRTSDYRATRT